MASTVMPARVGADTVLNRIKPWQQMLLLSVVYVVAGALLIHLLVTVAVMIIMPRPVFTWSRSADVYPFTHALRGFVVSGIVLFGILASRPVAPNWRQVLRSAGWATLYAVIVGALGFFLQLYVVNRRIGGWNQLGADKLLWVTPFQQANPRAIWFSLSALLIGTVAFLRVAGPRRFADTLRTWPARFARPFKRFGPASLGWLLWGASVGILTGGPLAPKAAATVALVAIIFAPSVLAEIVATLLRTLVDAIDALARLVGLSFGRVIVRPSNISLVLVGVAVALLVDRWLPQGDLRTVAFAVAMAGGLLLAGQGVGVVQLVVLTVAGGGAWLLLHPALAIADDGTWADGNVNDLYNSSGGPTSIDNAGDTGDAGGSGANPAGIAGERDRISEPVRTFVLPGSGGTVPPTTTPAPPAPPPATEGDAEAIYTSIFGPGRPTRPQPPAPRPFDPDRDGLPLPPPRPVSAPPHPTPDGGTSGTPIGR